MESQSQNKDLYTALALSCKNHPFCELAAPSMWAISVKIHTATLTHLVHTSTIHKPANSDAGSIVLTPKPVTCHGDLLSALTAWGGPNKEVRPPCQHRTNGLWAGKIAQWVDDFSLRPQIHVVEEKNWLQFFFFTHTHTHALSQSLSKCNTKFKIFKKFLKLKMNNFAITSTYSQLLLQKSKCLTDFYINLSAFSPTR